MSKKSRGFYMPPLVGYSFPLIIKLLWNNKVDFRYYWGAFFTSFVSFIGIPFRIYERLRFNEKVRKMEIKKPPLFILGHWRSGTTFLHNVISQDPQMGYVTTYHSVFPETLLGKLGSGFFKWFMHIAMPRTRKGDNVVLNPNFPQEEEFAVGCRKPLSYYYFWYFPQRTRDFYHRFIELENLTEKELADWQVEYDRLVRKSILNTQKDQVVIKNPANTGRVRQLLALYPDAKFIYIHRDPITVFLSTRNFFNKMMPNLQLQKFSDEERAEIIYYVYKRIMDKYEAEKSLIPPDNLVEVKFEDFEQAPFEQICKVYEQLNLEGLEAAKPYFEQYLESKKGYKKNEYQLSDAEKQEILSRLEKG